jgi:hypothetical protein
LEDLRGKRRAGGSGVTFDELIKLADDELR